MADKMEAKKKNPRDARREARRNAILKDPNQRLKILQKISDKKNSLQQQAPRPTCANQPAVVNDNTLIRRSINTLEDVRSNSEDNTQSIAPASTTPVMTGPASSTTNPPIKPQQLTIQPPSSLTTTIIQKLIDNDRSTILLRLIIPMIMSVIITVIDYSISIVFVALMNTLSLIAYILITQSNDNSQQSPTESKWLEFIPMLLGWYYPRLASRLTLLSLVLCVLYTFVTDLALIVFSLCFMELIQCLIINYSI